MNLRHRYVIIAGIVVFLGGCELGRSPKRTALTTTTNEKLSQLGFGEHLWLAREKMTTQQWSDGTTTVDGQSYLLLCTQGRDGPACRPVAMVDAPGRGVGASVPEPMPHSAEEASSVSNYCARFVKAAAAGDTQRFSTLVAACTRAFKDEPTGAFAGCVKTAMVDAALTGCMKKLGGDAGRGPPTYEIRTLADARRVADQLRATALGRTLYLKANTHGTLGVLKDAQGPIVTVKVGGDMQKIDLVNIVEVWVE